MGSPSLVESSQHLRRRWDVNSKETSHPRQGSPADCGWVENPQSNSSYTEWPLASRGERTSGSCGPWQSQSPTSWLFSPTYFEFPLSKLREGAPGTFQEQDKPVTTMPTDSAPSDTGAESGQTPPGPRSDPEPRPEAPSTRLQTRPGA